MVLPRLSPLFFLDPLPALCDFLSLPPGWAALPFAADFAAAYPLFRSRPAGFGLLSDPLSTLLFFPRPLPSCYLTFVALPVSLSFPEPGPFLFMPFFHFRLVLVVLRSLAVARAGLSSYLPPAPLPPCFLLSSRPVFAYVFLLFPFLSRPLAVFFLPFPSFPFFPHFPLGTRSLLCFCP